MTARARTKSALPTSDEFTIQPILCTQDIERLSSFYTELFGAEEVLRVPARKGLFFVTLKFGAAGLSLVNYKKGAEAAPGRVSVEVFVSNVDDLLTRVEPAGGKVLGQPKSMPWGHRVAHIEDPDGNPVNLTQQL